MLNIDPLYKVKAENLEYFQNIFSDQNTKLFLANLILIHFYLIFNSVKSNTNEKIVHKNQLFSLSQSHTSLRNGRDIKGSVIYKKYISYVTFRVLHEIPGT